MRRLIHYLGLTALLIAFGINAAAQSVAEFPPLRAAQETGGADMKVMRKANVIEPSKGTLIYACTYTASQMPCYVRFYTSNPYGMESLAEIFPEDDLAAPRMIAAGAEANGCLYGFIERQYTYGPFFEPIAFVKFDFATGKATTIRDMNDKNSDGYVSYVDYTPMRFYDMTYNYSDGKAYAVGYAIRNDYALSDLYTVDIATGRYVKVAELDFYAWAIACDYEGNFYAIKGIADTSGTYIGSSLVKLDKDFKETLVAELKDDEGSHIKPSYQHSLAFDHESNALFWVAMNVDAWQYLYKIDAKTGSSEKISSMGYNRVVAMSIPFEGAGSRDAAGKVTDITATSSATENVTTLTWKNPTVNWRGDELTELKCVTISRGTRDNVVKTMDATNRMGETETWTDNNAPQGINTYYFVAYRLEGEKGLVDSIQVYSGADAPGMVVNINASYDKATNTATLTWEEPTQSANGKDSYDKTGMTYKVVRMPENVVVAEALTETRLTDSNIETQGTHHYVITAKNSVGEGPEAQSPSIYGGAAIVPPYVEDFATEEQASVWTVVNNNGGDTFYGELHGGYCIYTTATASDDYIISPEISLEKGKSYKVTFNVTINDSREKHNFALTIGKGTTAEAQTTVIEKFEDIRPEGQNDARTLEGIVTIDEDGLYNIGFHCYSYASLAPQPLYVDGFSIHEVFSNDLAAEALDGPSDIVAEQETTINVLVKNEGSTAQSAYKVKILDMTNNANRLIATADGVTVEPQATVEVPVKITLTTTGTVKLIGTVELEGDQNTANDMTEVTEYEVLAANTIAWNVLCNGDNRDISTTIPIYLGQGESTCQTFYYKEELGQVFDGDITRMALEYSDNELDGPTEEFAVKIYMANTTRSTLADEGGSEMWIPLEDMQCVYTGNVRYEKGTNNLLKFEFNSPFRYDHTKNLCVQIWGSGKITSGAYGYPVKFNVYNVDWYTADLRTVKYSGASKLNYSGTHQGNPTVPVLHLAIDYTAGITELRLGGDRIGYSAGSIMLGSLDCKSVSVYDMAGKLISTAVPTDGQAAVKANLQKGLYIVKAVTRDGKVKTQKINVANE